MWKFSRLSVPRLTLCEGGGRGGGNSGLDTKLLGSDFWVPLQILFKESFLRAPLPSTSPASLLFLEPDASSRGTKERRPQDPPSSAPTLVSGHQV